VLLRGKYTFIELKL